MTDTAKKSSIRLVMVRETTNSPRIKSEIEASPLSVEDGAILGKLMYRAYKGTVDDNGETLEETVAEANATLNAKYGPMIFPASFATASLGMLTSAVVVTNYSKTGPLFAFILTDPDYQNQGLASQLIAKSLKTLSQLGIEQIRLVVTAENIPACRLYGKLGFTTESVKKAD